LPSPGRGPSIAMDWPQYRPLHGSSRLPMFQLERARLAAPSPSAPPSGFLSRFAFKVFFLKTVCHEPRLSSWRQFVLSCPEHGSDGTPTRARVPVEVDSRVRRRPLARTLSTRPAAGAMGHVRGPPVRQGASAPSSAAAHVRGGWGAARLLRAGHRAGPRRTGAESRSARRRHRLCATSAGEPDGRQRRTVCTPRPLFLALRVL